MDKKDDVVSRIENVINKIRPYINSEGGELDFVDFVDGIVYIRMSGACVGCGAKTDTFDGIQTLLQEYVPEVIGVKDVTYEEM